MRSMATLAALLLGSVPAVAADPTDATYVNVRYRYAVCYPPALLKPQGEADDSDGQSFIARDGARLDVFGGLELARRSLRAMAEADAADLAGPRGVVTYRAGGSGWYVYSGRNGTADFYAKMLRRGDEVAAIELHYPHALADRYRPIVERLSRCFVLTR